MSNLAPFTPDETPNAPDPRSAEEQHHICDTCAHYDDTIDPCDPEAVPNEPCPHCTQYARSGDDDTDLWTPRGRPEDTPDTEPETDGAQSRPSPRPDHGVTWLKHDTIRKALPLSDEDKLMCGKEMADALAKIEDYEAELDAQRKYFKRLIEEQEKLAADAARQFTEGMGPEQDIDCDVYQDWNTDELVYVEAAEPFAEIMRRKMTQDEMRPTLFDKALQGAPAPVGNTIGTPHATNRRTCLDCANMADRTDGGDMPEPCQRCAQAANGEADNWTPARECRTCAHASNDVAMPPCCNCALNVDEGHRGDEDRWECDAEEGFFDPTTGDITPLIPATSTPETASV